MPAAARNLLGMGAAELTAFCVELGEKPFRARQLWRWMYQFGVSDFTAMTDLRRDLRARLTAIATITAPPVAAEACGADGTRKWALDLGDGQAVETVFIPEQRRNTLCVSTQAGCSVGCAFCRTGAGGFNRNLTAAEIVGQVWRAAQTVGFSRNQEEKPISNVVLMGMGEPLLNLNAVLPAVDILLSDYGFALSKRRVTISTVGVPQGIDRLTAAGTDVALAWSLHAPDDALRDRLVPLNHRYPIAAVLAAVRRYLAASNANCGRVTIEYVLLDGVNDSLAQAEALARLLRHVPCKINLIPFNPYPGARFARPAPARVERFYQELLAAGFTVIKRSTRGDDIDAACGQLAGRITARNLPTAPSVPAQGPI